MWSQSHALSGVRKLSEMSPAPFLMWLNSHMLSLSQSLDRVYASRGEEETPPGRKEQEAEAGPGFSGTHCTVVSSLRLEKHCQASLWIDGVVGEVISSEQMRK